MFDPASLEQSLRSVAPTALSAARDALHKAAQLPARAAIANLEEREDWSHTALQWDAETASFVGQPLGDGVAAALRLAEATLELRADGALAFEMRLDGADEADVAARFDAALRARGLEPASAAPPTSGLPDGVSALSGYGDGSVAEARVALTAWYDLAAHALAEFAAEKASIQPGPTAVYCWPHHFDIATLVRLAVGDPETAPSVGVGLSPGDGAYDEPYLYVNPWPTPKPEGLPAAPAPGRWHTDGFVGLVATGSEILTTTDPAAALRRFVGEAFAVAEPLTRG